MREVLTQLNAVPGVVGAMICDQHGTVLADAFPPRFDREVPGRAARVLADGAAGLAAALGTIGKLDIRFGDARLVVTPVAGARVVVLCSPAMNVQPLAMSTAAALPKLEKLLSSGVAGRGAKDAPGTDDLGLDGAVAALQDGATPAAPAVAAEVAAAAPDPAPAAAVLPQAGQLYQALQRINAAIERKQLDPFRTRGAIALRAGFGLALIDPGTPDDDAMLGELLGAARAVLGEAI